MTPEEIADSLRRSVEIESGKPLVVFKDPAVSGHGSVRVATPDTAMHVLRYPPSADVQLPYLTAFHCGMLLRSLRAESPQRFDLVSTAAMRTESQQLIQAHLKTSGADVPESLIPNLCSQLGDGLGIQLRSMPIAIRVDHWLWQQYPSLQELQRTNVSRQLQESMQTLGPSVRALVPLRMLNANLAMNCAFAMFWGELWGEPELAVPYTLAGFEAAGRQLLEMVRSIDSHPNGDRQLVEQWASQLNLTAWYRTVTKQ